jgi:hypothetical protein
VIIRQCNSDDFDAIFSTINDAAQAYKGVIPDDCWKEPYISREELKHEIDNGVMFWGYEKDEELVGVMGLQQGKDVTYKACICSHKREKPRHRKQVIALSPKTDYETSSDGGMERCHMGH